MQDLKTLPMHDQPHKKLSEFIEMMHASSQPCGQNQYFAEASAIVMQL
jgi:hypothetical protein